MNRIIPLILAVALFMENMDSTVIATSLPAIAADIGAEPISLKLALTSYFVALAIFIPLSGWVADRFGARNVFRSAIVVFMAGSICCAFSFSLETFVGARFLQGMGASMMTPLARLVLVRTTPRTELVSAMAWLTVPALIGPLTGPPIGGLLTTYLSWHWIFWINIPIGLAGIVLTSIYLPKIETRTPRPIDFPGFVMAGIAFAGIIFGLSVISLPAIPLMAGYAAVGIGAASALLYWRHTRRTEHPLLDPQLLVRHRMFRAAILGGSVFRIGVGATPFLLPLMLQLAFGLTPFESGMITFIGALGAMLSKFGAERVFAAYGFPRVLVVASVGACLSLAVIGFFGPETPSIFLYAVLLAMGLMRSMFFTGVNALGFADVDEHEASQAAAISAVSQQLSVAFGVAVAGAALEVSAQFMGELSLGAFHVAWFVVAGISLVSALWFWRLPPDAGSDVSGHRQKPDPQTDPAS